MVLTVDVISALGQRLAVLEMEDATPAPGLPPPGELIPRAAKPHRQDSEHRLRGN